MLRTCLLKNLGATQGVYVTPFDQNQNSAHHNLCRNLKSPIPFHQRLQEIPWAMCNIGGIDFVEELFYMNLVCSLKEFVSMHSGVLPDCSAVVTFVHLTKRNSDTDTSFQLESNLLFVGMDGSPEWLLASHATVVFLIWASTFPISLTFAGPRENPCYEKKQLHKLQSRDFKGPIHKTSWNVSVYQ